MPLPTGSLLEHTPQGLYCRAAAAWIDPVGPVPRALITHAHADHARPGCGEYWAVGASEAILRQRLGASINLIPVDYGALHRIGEARVSSTAPATCSAAPRSGWRRAAKAGW